MKRSLPFNSQGSAKRLPFETAVNPHLETPRSNGVPFNGARLMNSTMDHSQNLNGTVDSVTQGPTQRKSAVLEPPTKLYFFTGTADKVLTWHRVFKQKCLFEVIAPMVSIQKSRDNVHYTILLRDKNRPVLQVIHYLNHVLNDIEFTAGQMLRCVGYMTGINIMTCVNIRRATAEEIASLKRFCTISEFSISTLINAEGNP